MTDDSPGGSDSAEPVGGIATDQVEVSNGVGAQRAILAVALLALVVAVAVGVSTLRSNSAAGGATPEEAVTILRAMRAGSRTEIIAQMKSEDEKKVASDLLEGLRAPSVSGGLQETSDAERTATAAPN